MASNTARWTERFVPAQETLRWGFLVVNVELIALWVWMLATKPALSPLGFRYALYPLIWIDVGLWAVWRTKPTPTTTRRRYLAGAVATGYFLLLAYVGGLVGPATGAAIAPNLHFGLPPGFSPTLVYDGAVVKLTVFPYKLVGYLALTYLVYATVIDAAGSAVSGVLGLVSCVSCTWPVVATLLSGVLGGGSAIASAAYGYSYDLSVVVFVLTVGLLYWRPTVR